MNAAFGPAPECPRQEARVAELRNPPFPSTVLTQHPGRGAMPLIRRAALKPVLDSAPKILSCLRSSVSVPLSTQQPVSSRCPATADYQQSSWPRPGLFRDSELPARNSLHPELGGGGGWGNFQEVLEAQSREGTREMGQEGAPL